MGSFFVLQTHTGFEVEAKEMLKVALQKKGIQSVKCIYAMEKAECVNEEMDYTELTNGDITQHLHIKRLQAGLTNLRQACDRLKSFHDDESLTLLNSYRKNIRDLTAQLKEARKSMKKVSSVLSGYILLEINDNRSTFPAELFAVIRSVPRITGLVNRNNVQPEEVEYFFQQLDMTEEIEIEFDMLVDVGDLNEVEKTEQILLAEANEKVGTQEEKEILETIDSLNVSLEEEFQQITVDSEATLAHSDEINILRLLRRTTFVKQRTREKMKMPARLFEWLFGERNDWFQTVQPMRHRLVILRQVRTSLFRHERLLLT
ncbi:transcription termination/antitermination NusG family protein [Pseudobacillus badius]|uniref:transcription termination/antitermination NusG family protein n=1 Tax=Bacillus badius TaxID=1455 RepID=UPI001CBFA7E9|nr:transcription termination/antitermination NusG family protein [Bacillus badius]UAT28929.1 hypothetical protein K7T73_09780 [Bacillus badius]GLY12692.1 hypothetical protein Bbad01_39080 [Bacillus badius]